MNPDVEYVMFGECCSVDVAAEVVVKVVVEILMMNDEGEQR